MRRDGHVREVSVHDIAVGDVVVVEAGDKVGDFGDVYMYVCMGGWVCMDVSVWWREGMYTHPHLPMFTYRKPNNPTQPRWRRTGCSWSTTT